MAIVNLNWYNLQSLRRYPLADGCTGETDDGRNLPDDILVDCKLTLVTDVQLNSSAAKIFVEAVTVSENIVTVLLAASITTVFGTSTYSAAAVSLQKPVEAGVHYAVTPLVDNIAGWVVFGDGIQNNFSGKFSTTNQTALQSRCATLIAKQPVNGMKKSGADAVLTGIVSLTVNPPLSVSTKKLIIRPPHQKTGEYREIYTAIYIGLDEGLISTAYNPLSYFLNTCAGRPESGTCPKAGIQTINGISPDCEGNINLVFDGLTEYKLGPEEKPAGGIAIATDYGMRDVCQENKKLPLFYTDTCCPQRFDTIAERDTIPATDFQVNDVVRIGVPPETDANPYTYYRAAAVNLVAPADPEDPDSVDQYAVVWEEVFKTDPDLEGLLKNCDWPDPTSLIPDVVINLTQSDYPELNTPLCVDFCSCSADTPPLFKILTGTFSVEKIKAPRTYCENCAHGDSISPDMPILIPEPRNDKLTEHNTLMAHGAGRSIALLKGAASDWAIGKTAATTFKIMPVGLNRAGGLVFNYRTTVRNGLTQISYYAVKIDVARAVLQLVEYVGDDAQLLAETTFNATTNTWYTISAQTIILDGSVAVSATVTEFYSRNVTANISNFLITLRNYEPLTGAFGLLADRATIYFNEFSVA